MQLTLGIIPFNTKSDFLVKISKNDIDLKIVVERQFDLSIEIAQQVLNKAINEQEAVFGFIVEGSNAIEDWLNIIRNENSLIFHGSANPTNAQSETDWFQDFVSTKTPSSSSSSSSAIPIKVNNAVNRKNVLKKPTIITKSSVSGTSSINQRRVGLRGGDTTVTPNNTTSGDGPGTLKKPIVRSKIPNAKITTATTTSTLKSTNARPSDNNTTTTSRITKTITTMGSATASSRRSDLNGRRGSLATTATNGTLTKKLTTTTKGGISKNTPPTSVITGRTRKYSKLTEKKPVATTIKTKKDIPFKEEENNNEMESEKEEVIIEQEAVIEAIVLEKEEIIVVQEKEEEVLLVEEDGDEIILIQQPVSHPSTCSSVDEHDAEVAATTSNKNNTNNVKATSYVLQNSGRSSSFSPSSVSSLPRPETPEVDQLRLRFETIIQTSSPTSTYDPQLQRRSSSRMSSEFISRIKEMKPKGPVGSKVKSMVELFMDENLNKWEF